MRRSSFMAWSIVLFILALMLPATAVGSSQYQEIVLDQSCTQHGGAYGHGSIGLSVKAKEIGASGTNYFVIKSKVQTSTGAGWGTVFAWPDKMSSVFPDDATSHHRVIDRVYDKPTKFAYKLIITVQFWSNTDGLLATRTAKTVCY